MADNKRLFLSLPEEDVKKLDVLRAELGMNRSRYIRYLLSGQKKQICPSNRYREVIEKLSGIDLKLRVLVLKESLTSTDKLLIYSKLQEIKRILSEGNAFGQVGQSRTGEVDDGRTGNGC